MKPIVNPMAGCGARLGAFLTLTSVVACLAFPPPRAFAGEPADPVIEHAAATTYTTRVGGVLSTQQNDTQSFLRFFNYTTTPSTVTVTLLDYTTGNQLAQWTTPTIAVGAAPQFSISTVESGADRSFTKPAYYSLVISTTTSGLFFQHVLWHISDGTLTNSSTCSTGATVNSAAAANVHSSILAAGYPSSIIIYNSYNNPETVALDIHNAATGNLLGTYSAGFIPINGQVIVPVTTMEQGAHVTPTSNMYHYVVYANLVLSSLATSSTLKQPFPGYIEHRVNNAQAGVITDMTTVCPFK